MNYRHLTREQRYQIQSLLRAGCLRKHIAAAVECHASTITRELKRNREAGGYAAPTADQQACARRQQASQRPRIEASTWAVVEARLRKQWSPEQIAGRAARERRHRVSHERIYQYIAADRCRGGTLWRCLRQRKRRYRRRCVPGRFARARSIRQRPVGVEQRRYCGHWEGDTMVGSRGRAALVTVVERRSRFLRLQRVPSRKARQVTRALLAKLVPLAARVDSLTCDRGSEFAEFGLIEQALQAPLYFADPYSPWQRGSNENTNGLIRQYLPRSRCIADVSDAEIQHIENLLNDRPRKKLNYQTPSEVLLASLKRVALRT